jgi:hypothetical protein
MKGFFCLMLQLLPYFRVWNLTQVKYIWADIDGNVYIRLSKKTLRSCFYYFWVYFSNLICNLVSIFHPFLLPMNLQTFANSVLLLYILISLWLSISVVYSCFFFLNLGFWNMLNFVFFQVLTFFHDNETKLNLDS